MSELPRKPVVDDDAADEVKTSGNGEVASSSDADRSPAMEEAPPATDPTADARPTGNGGPATVEAPQVVDDAETRRYPVNLEAQEAKPGQDGPHPLTRHGDLTDDQLRDRFKNGAVKYKASTFTDRQTAQEKVQGAIDQNEGKIEEWLGRDGEGDLTTDPVSYPEPVGRVLSKDDYLQRRDPTPANTVTLQLKRDDGPPGFVVHTVMLTNRTEARTR